MFRALGGFTYRRRVLLLIAGALFLVASGAAGLGLSMDYKVFLLSRIRESYDQTGDNTAAMALGIERTGGIITSAAVLLGVVILGFAAGRVGLGEIEPEAPVPDPRK